LEEIGQEIHRSFPLRRMESLLSAVAGTILLLLGLRLCGLLSGTAGGDPGGALGSCLAALGRDRRVLAGFVFGIFNGFLPCPLVFAVACHAASTGSLSRAMLAMFVLRKKGGQIN